MTNTVTFIFYPNCEGNVDIVTKRADTSVYCVLGVALIASETSAHAILTRASGDRNVIDAETHCKEHSLVSEQQH